MRGRHDLARSGRCGAMFRGVLSAAVMVLLAGPTIHAQDEPADPPPMDEDDGSGRLLVGSLMPITVGEAGQLELGFLADGAGMLTLAWSSSIDDPVQVQVISPTGRMLALDNGENNRRRGGWAAPMPVQTVISPLGRAGLYRVQVTAPPGTQLILGGAWLPFGGMQGQETEAIATPQPDQTVAVTPGVRQQVRIPRERTADGEYIQWMSFTAEEDGQLAMMFSAPAGDIRLMLYENGNFSNEIEYVDNDMRGDTAMESILIDARAGQTYYLRVIDIFGGNRVQVRSIWLGEDDDEAEDGAPRPPRNNPIGNRRDLTDAALAVTDTADDAAEDALDDADR